MIFNRLPEKLIPFAQSLCAALNTEYFGCLPAHEYAFESRHLGLVNAQETADLKEKTDALDRLAAQYICLDRLLTLGEPLSTPPEMPQYKAAEYAPVIAVARDRAFCFLYEENLEMLAEMGCKIVYFSPMHDAHLPAADGLYLCGGYPELYARALSENTGMRGEIRSAVAGSMPVIAECGGFLYLHDTLRTKSGEIYPMAGVIRADAFPGARLRQFGYITLHPAADSLICSAGAAVRAHEFHYWQSTAPGSAFRAEKPDGQSWQCAHVSDTMYAGFPHLYLPAAPDAAARFVRACGRYGGAHGTD